MTKAKSGDETPAKKTTKKTETGVHPTEPTSPAPAPNAEKPKKGKVEVASDAAPVENDAANQRLEDAKNQAINNHAKSQR